MLPETLRAQSAAEANERKGKCLTDFLKRTSIVASTSILEED